jgi:hypothetical protein
LQPWCYAAGAAARISQSFFWEGRMMTHTLPPLPYAKDALSPLIEVKGENT